jgi:hypothetical protein
LLDNALAEMMAGPFERRVKAAPVCWSNQGKIAALPVAGTLSPYRPVI